MRTSADRLAGFLSLFLCAAVQAPFAGCSSSSGIPVTCAPACRTGYTCVDGACVSACNPPCDANQVCVAGNCVIASADAGPFSDASATADDSGAPPDPDWSPFDPQNADGLGGVGCMAVAWGGQVGAYRGVPAFSNASCSSHCNCGCTSPSCDASGCGIQWQCVEYVERFYHELWNTLRAEYGVQTGPAECNMRHSGNANQLYAATTPCLAALKHFPNLGIDAPEPADIITWIPNGKCQNGDATCQYGHTAIIRDVNRSGGQIVSITIIQQNVKQNSCDGASDLNVAVDQGGHYSIDTIGTKFSTQGWMGLRGACVRNCAGKCGGAPDGCGKTCEDPCLNNQLICLNQLCVPCGNNGQPCCKGDVCSGLQCANGRCGNCVNTCGNKCGGPDGCGNTCPDICKAPQTCGGGGQQFLCGCTPNCNGKCGGPDGCGGQCPNTCAPPQTCGGGGQPNVCGCTPNCNGKCGGAADGCGGNTCVGQCGNLTICINQSCVACGNNGQPCCVGNTCNGLQCTNGMCGACPPMCNGKCGGPDGCGNNCPDMCKFPQTCGGGGQQNVCGCTPTCNGRCGGADGCGSTCLDNCAFPQTCGGGGQQNVCGCTSTCNGKCGGPDGCNGLCKNNCIAPQTCGGGGQQNVCGCTPNCTGKCGGAADGCLNTCNGACAGKTVCSNQSCVVCGANGQLCCLGNVCDNGLACNGNTCAAAACPNGNGLYCGGHGIAGNAGSLYQCTNGALNLSMVCAVSCLNKPPGVSDVCAACPSGNGQYCGGHGIVGNVGSLYQCTNGGLTFIQVCAKGCANKPAGQNDICTP